MIGISAVRHSDTGPVKKSPYELLYIDTYILCIFQQRFVQVQNATVVVYCSACAYGQTHMFGLEMYLLCTCRIKTVSIKNK